MRNIKKCANVAYLFLYPSYVERHNKQTFMA
jgi:hypothetical protein